MDEGDVEKRKPTLKEVLSDSGLAIVAGSDTTATVLAHLFWHIMSEPEIYSRLQKEVDEAFPRSEGDPFDAAKLADMSFLDAVM
jgi:cytochrome P450